MDCGAACNFGMPSYVSSMSYTRASCATKQTNERARPQRYEEITTTLAPRENVTAQRNAETAPHRNANTAPHRNALTDTTTICIIGGEVDNNFVITHDFCDDEILRISQIRNDDDLTVTRKLAMRADRNSVNFKSLRSKSRKGNLLTREKRANSLPLALKASTCGNISATGNISTTGSISTTGNYVLDYAGYPSSIAKFDAGLYVDSGTQKTAATPPPTYRSLIRHNLADIPPSYETVTGKVLNLGPVIYQLFPFF